MELIVLNKMLGLFVCLLIRSERCLLLFFAAAWKEANVVWNSYPFSISFQLYGRPGRRNRWPHPTNIENLAGDRYR